MLAKRYNKGASGMSYREIAENPEAAVKKLASGDKLIASRIISLIEQNDSCIPRVMAYVEKCLGKAHVVGFAGVPGVRKSTLIGQVIGEYRSRGKRGGGLCIDPSSPVSGGAVLGDRIRMQQYAVDDSVFVRSFASRSALGGISRATIDSIKVLDACGYDVILIEGVGAWQLDVKPLEFSHTGVVVLSPVSGDLVQMIKAGLVELGHVVVVNKADDPNADLMVMYVEEAIRMRPTRSLWEPKVIKTIATEGVGVKELVDLIEEHRQFLVENNLMGECLERMRRFEVHELVMHNLVSMFENEYAHNPEVKEILDEVGRGEISVHRAVEAITDILLNRIRHR